MDGQVFGPCVRHQVFIGRASGFGQGWTVVLSPLVHLLMLLGALVLVWFVQSCSRTWRCSCRVVCRRLVCCVGVGHAWRRREECVHHPCGRLERQPGAGNLFTDPFAPAAQESSRPLSVGASVPNASQARGSQAPALFHSRPEGATRCLTYGRAAAGGGGADRRAVTSVAPTCQFVDHAVWGPFRRKATNLDFYGGRIVHLEGVVWPGEQELHTIGHIWRVFKATASMLGILSVASAALCEKVIERHTRLWSSSWHLNVTADDKCRTEHIERIRWGLEEMRLTSKEVPTDYVR